MPYSLLRLLRSLGDVLDNSVIARFLTLIMIRCASFHFFFDHRPQRVTYVLPKVFYKFIAETNREIKRSKYQCYLLTRAKEFSTQRSVTSKNFLPCH